MVTGSQLKAVQLSVLVGVGLVAVTALLPQTQWAFRNDVDVLMGGCRHLVVASAGAVTSPVRLCRFEGAGDRDMLSGALTPARLALTTASPLDNLPVYATIHPADEMGWAHLLRLSYVPQSVPRQPAASKSIIDRDLLALMKAAETARRLDPQNGFYPLMQAVAARAEGNQEAASNALAAAGRAGYFNDHAVNEVSVRYRELQTLYGYRGEVVKNRLLTSVAYPYLGAVRELARSVQNGSVHRSGWRDRANLLAVAELMVRQTARCPSSFVGGEIAGSLIGVDRASPASARESAARDFDANAAASGVTLPISAAHLLPMLGNMPPAPDLAARDVRTGWPASLASSLLLGAIFILPLIYGLAQLSARIRNPLPLREAAPYLGGLAGALVAVALAPNILLLTTIPLLIYMAGLVACRILRSKSWALALCTIFALGWLLVARKDAVLSLPAVAFLVGALDSYLQGLDGRPLLSKVILVGSVCLLSVLWLSAAFSVAGPGFTAGVLLLGVALVALAIPPTKRSALAPTAAAFFLVLCLGYVGSISWDVATNTRIKETNRQMMASIGDFHSSEIPRF